MAAISRIKHAINGIPWLLSAAVGAGTERGDAMSQSSQKVGGSEARDIGIFREKESKKDEANETKHEELMVPQDK
ncbi:hypothetical protein NDU88_000834 [Pleurodeles waltl]|uniref:Uncharacterized protein n=1 Tax=Pleurodeles waltl TaxID=8319 RepID=A0AAV7M6E5_PLEWA|nr:hypothetical protein NDU88_000834 [Pleurodeles waltl]